MKNADMKSELDRANAMLVDKLGKQPYMRFDLKLTDSGRWAVCGAWLDPHMRNHIAGDFCDTPDEAFASVFQVLDNMPDPDTKARQDWQGKLGKVIDEGHALNLPDEVMDPLRQGSQAMTENLLSAPKREAVA